VRRQVLSNFDERKLATGTPMSNLEEVFVPVYLFHRFQTEAAAKRVGGIGLPVYGEGLKRLDYQGRIGYCSARSLGGFIANHTT